MLTRVRPNGVKHADTPAIYTPPSYGRKGPQPATQLPPSTPATEDEVSQLRTIVGSLLYYSLAVDSTILPAVCALACQQACATAHTLKAADRLLGYVAKHPNASITYRPSDMLLRAHSDASFLSRPNSGSVAGGYQYLGNRQNNHAFNHPILTFSTLIPVIVASATEAEYAAVYANCVLACDVRRTLANMGYPQPPTPILTDNECAVGLANGSLKIKMAKSTNMHHTGCKIE